MRKGDIVVLEGKLDHEFYTEALEDFKDPKESTLAVYFSTPGGSPIIAYRLANLINLRNVKHVVCDWEVQSAGIAFLLALRELSDVEIYICEDCFGLVHMAAQPVGEYTGPGDRSKTALFNDFLKVQNENHNERFWSDFENRMISVGWNPENVVRLKGLFFEGEDLLLSSSDMHELFHRVKE